MGKQSQQQQRQSQAQPVGESRVFVLSPGYRQFGAFQALVDAEGWMRVFFAVYADPDNPRSRPQEAWESLLRAMPHGAAVRFLLSWWPEQTQRLAFVENLRAWPNPEQEARKTLRDGLLAAALYSPLPFERRVVLEFRLPPKEELAQWLVGIPDMLSAFGLTCQPLSQKDIEAMASHVFNPEV